MRFLASEINHDLIEEKIPLGHATEAPAFVQTKGARLQFLELLGPGCGQFSRLYKFFQVRLHANRTNYDEDFDWREKTLIKGVYDCGKAPAVKR